MSDLSQMSTAAQATAAQLAGIRPPNGMPPGGGLLAQAAQAQRAAAAEPAKAAPAGEKPKKKKPIKPIALAVVLLLVGYVAKGKIMKPHYAPGEKVPLGAIFDLGTVTTNLGDGHLAQIGVSLQMTAVASSKEETKDTSELLGSVVSALGASTYDELLPASGRSALATTLLHDFQVDLGTSEGAQQVSQVYFTSFVLQ